MVPGRIVQEGRVFRGLLADVDLRGQFSGHETFPVRYGWFNKVFDAVANARGENPFSRPEAVADLGVGKNMVGALKHWGLASGIIEADRDGFQIARFGELLLGRDGFDPYVETQTALWLLHWKIVRSARKATTWYWAFNHFPALLFDQERMYAELGKLCEQRKWKVAPTTLKRDIECFVKMYSPSLRASGRPVTEDALESPFCELGLIKPAGLKGTYQFQRGPKPSLNDSVFLYALDSFWSQHTTASTLTVESVCYEPGSPGRVFKLDEESVIERLNRVGDYSQGCFGWSDTSGLRQVARLKTQIDSEALLKRAFSARRIRQEAT